MSTEILCHEHTVKVDELARRCNVQEVLITELRLHLTRTETRLKELEERHESYACKVTALQAWKNKALGYVGLLGIITMYIIESLREHFWGNH